MRALRGLDCRSAFGSSWSLESSFCGSVTLERPVRNVGQGGMKGQNQAYGRHLYVLQATHLYGPTTRARLTASAPSSHADGCPSTPTEQQPTATSNSEQISASVFGILTEAEYALLSWHVAQLSQFSRLFRGCVGSLHLPRPRLLKRCFAKLRGVFHWQGLIGVRQGTQRSHTSCEWSDSVRSNVASAVFASLFDVKLSVNDQVFGACFRIPVSAGDL